MKKLILTELEKKKILKMYGVINEQEGSDPNNPDSYPDHDELGFDDAWSWYEWTVYYNALEKKHGEDFAKKRFLKYWEPVEAGTFVKADNDMDPQWFKDKNMWNESENRPYKSSELPELDNQKKETKNPTGVSDSLVDFVKKEEFFVPCVYDDYRSSACIRGEMKKCCLRGRPAKGDATIGYGTVYYPNNKKVKSNDPDISESKATELLKSNLNKFASSLISIYPNLKQNQLDALTSLCYNTGWKGCTKNAPNLTKEITINPDSTKNKNIKPNFIDFANKDRRIKEFKIYHEGKYE